MASLYTTASGAPITASAMRVPRDARPWARPQVASPRGLHLGLDESGLFPRRALLEHGWTPAAIRSAIAAGRLRPVRRGLYAAASPHPDALRAARHGYRLTCMDALSLHGVWVPEPAAGSRSGLHVYAPRAVRPPHWAHLHPPFLQSWPEPDPVASLPLALAHAIRCSNPESAAVVLESAIDRGLLSGDEAVGLLRAAPERHGNRIGRISTASGSGSETRVVRSLRRRGFQVEQQVFVEEVGFVDAYVGGVFLEVDGRSRHAGTKAFDDDRRRDLALRRRGLEVLRVSYQQVWRDWERTRRAIDDAVRELGPRGRRAVERLG
jgi:very-short-patch-repair endonuclease